MIKQPLDYAVWAWFVLDLIAFGYMVVGFARLFAQAWRMPDRWAAVWKVMNVKPRRNHEWPNRTPEADLILRGAVIGFFLFSIAFAFVIVVVLRGPSG